MAIKEIKREWCPSQLAYVKEFLLHCEDELQHMPRCSVGSKATVSETDNEYVKTTDGWKLLCDCDEDGGTGGGGSGVQPDWNQNDETAADYVKNRTHYSEIVTTQFANNVTVETSGEQPANDPFVMSEIIEGATYTVTWDGTTYECIAYFAEGPNSLSIGNGAVGGVSGGNEEPFFITIYNGKLMVFGDAGTHTVSVVANNVETVHTIDPKYIPVSDRTPGEKRGLKTLLEFTATNGQKENDGANAFTINDLPFDVDTNAVYTVVIDGVTYEGVPVQITGGSSCRVGSIESGTHPFEIRCVYKDSGFVVRYFHVVSDEEKHEVKVGERGMVVERLNPKYLPTDIDIPADGKLTLTDAHGGKWKLAVNPDGTLTTEAVTE